jgi:hypothetical protein
MATIVLNWTPANNPTSTGQLVQRRLAGTISWGTLATVSATTATYTDSTAADNTLYDYQIVNTCSVGGPTASGVVQANNIICPTVTTDNPQTGAADTIVVSYPNLTGSVEYSSISLMEQDTTTLVDGPHALSGQGSGTYTFSTGLQYDTVYYVLIVLSDGTFTKDCLVQTGVGSAPDCGAPSNLTATVQQG